LGLAKGENPLYDPLFETIGEEEDGMNMVFGTQGISQVGSRGAFRTTLNAFRRAFRAETAATAWHPIGELQGKYGRHNILSPHDIKVHDTEERLRLWKAYVQPFAVNQIRPTLVSMTNALGAQARTARKSKSPVIDVPEQFGVRAGEALSNRPITMPSSRLMRNTGRPGSSSASPRLLKVLHPLPIPGTRRLVR
jgi:hypothetical protein